MPHRIVTTRSRTAPITHVLTLVLTIAAICGAQQVAANPFVDRLMPGRSVEADPNADYTLTDRHGPWFVMAVSLSGPDAERQARALTLELRQRYHLESYTHAMKFDFTKRAAGRGVDRYGKPRQLRYQRDKEIHEIAVLVGNFTSADDAEIQPTLKKIKHMQPDALKMDGQKGARSGQSLGMMRRIQAALLPEDDERRNEGPMGHAFVTRSPLLSREYFVPKGVDTFVEKMNNGVEFTLLDCPGIYTIKVATFNGASRIEGASTGGRGTKNLDSKLARAAHNAHKLTIALRERGYEAYEFHDRSQSIVTIGSFESVGTELPDGQIKYPSEIQAILRLCCAGNQPSILPEAATNHEVRGKMARANQMVANMGSSIDAVAGVHPKHLLGIPFDVQPAVYEVPKKSISSDYARPASYP